MIVDSFDVDWVVPVCMTIFKEIMKNWLGMVIDVLGCPVVVAFNIMVVMMQFVMDIMMALVITCNVELMMRNVIVVVMHGLLVTLCMVAVLVVVMCGSDGLVQIMTRLFDRV